MRWVSPKRISATGAIKSGAGFLYAITLQGGSANSTVVLNDSLAGAGTDVYSLAAVLATSQSVTFNPPIHFATGIYATLAGAGAIVSVAYE